MIFKLILVVALIVFADSQGQQCSVRQRGTVRLQKGTNYAGVVELCWKAGSQQPYRWLPLCDENNGWTESEAEAVCRALGISTEHSGAKALVSATQESFQGWRMKCNRRENCTLQTTDIRPSFYGRFATAICDLPTQGGQPSPECTPSATTQVPTEAEKVQTPEGASRNNCSECPATTTSFLGGVGQTQSQTGCVVLIGILGSSTAVTTLLLVAMVIGCLWSCRHHKAVHYMDSHSDEKVVVPTDGQSHMDNPTYGTDYNAIHGQAQHVTQATPSPIQYHQPAMYDTIEDPVTTRNTTREREPLYHELDESISGGVSRNNVRTETGRNGGGVSGQGTVRLAVEGQSATLSSEAEFNQSPLDYYEVPVKTT